MNSDNSSNNNNPTFNNINSLINILSNDDETSEEMFIQYFSQSENQNLLTEIQKMLESFKDNSNIFNIDTENQEIIDIEIEFQPFPQQLGEEGNDDINDNNQFPTLINLTEDTEGFENCHQINDALGKASRIKSDDPLLSEYCHICMDNYKEKEFKRVIPACNHCFHKKCIDKWLKKKGNCPICRTLLLEKKSNIFISEGGY
jgi:hypothetical protein